MINQLKKAHPVAELCRTLQMPRSSYYARSRRQGRVSSDGSLLAAVRKIHRDNRRSYGTRRMAGELQDQGYAVGRHRGDSDRGGRRRISDPQQEERCTEARRGGTSEGGCIRYVVRLQ